MIFSIFFFRNLKIIFSTFLGRFYLDRAGQAVVRMVDAQFEYTYEYQVI